MPRKKRYVHPGELTHTIFRTYNHDFLFKLEEDHEIFLHTLKRQSKRYQNQIFAWTGMSNHQHVLQNAPLQWHEETAFARRKKLLGEPIFPGDMNRDSLSYFTRRFNWSNKRKGGLVQDRSKALPIQGKIGALIILVYIHLNPVRAKIVKKPEEYRYSNYRQYAFNQPTFKFARLFTKHPVLEELGKNEIEQGLHYQEIVEEASKDWANWRWRVVSGVNLGPGGLNSLDFSIFLIL